MHINMSYKDFDPHFVLLRENSKLPAFKYKNRNFSNKEILDHLNKGGNLGLLSQPNFIFIDIDNSINHENANGLDSFWKWCDENDIDLEKLMDETLVQETASGGLHLIFLKPKGMTFKQDISFLNGVDIKASKNNYIVIQPSKINGKSYKFYDKDKDPIELPAKLAKTIEKQSNETKKSKKVVVDQPDNGMLYHQHGKYTRIDPFFNIENGFGDKGTRNDNLTKWSSAMRRITTKETALKMAKIANSNTPVPMDEDEMKRTIESAFEYDDFVPNTIKNDEGVEWVILKSKKHSTDDYAVLKSRYLEVKSIDPDDYDKSDLYLYGMLYRGNEDFQTIYNYKESD